MLVTKKTLIIFASSLWLFASYMLFRKAFVWANELSTNQLMGLSFTGLLIAFVKSYFIFHRITIANIARIKGFTQQKISLWQFHANKYKLIIVSMIFFGIILRRISFIPKSVLFPIYLGLGFSMFYVFTLYLSKLKEF
jgi:hypothetical protein